MSGTSGKFRIWIPGKAIQLISLPDMERETLRNVGSFG